MNQCIFCKIANKEINTTPVLETDNFVVIKDINPKNKTHLLILTKKHYPDLNSFQAAPEQFQEFFDVIKQLGTLLTKNHYNISINTGKESGQEIFHFHAHFLSSATLSN